MPTTLSFVSGPRGHTRRCPGHATTLSLLRAHFLEAQVTDGSRALPPQRARSCHLLPFPPCTPCHGERTEFSPPQRAGRTVGDGLGGTGSCAPCEGVTPYRALTGTVNLDPAWGLGECHTDHQKDSV